uniref:Uncharacterized protein n=1 Tax=Tanacetum cinerariifolium TaxID=118510 RepID=A0A6L2LZY8_TANCI|nr:hypothetical protein [Tanacetum cinerariifolium]
MTSKAQQIELDNAIVALENHRVISKYNMRINPRMKPKELTYQVVLDAFALTTCYPAFLITAEVSGMYYKKNLDFVALLWEDLAYQIDNIDSKKQDKMFYPIFTKIIIHHFLKKDKSISMRNITFMHTPCDGSLLGTMRFVSRHADTHVYGVILPKAMTNQALLDTVAYKTYYAIASGAEPLKSRKSQKKSDPDISSEEFPSKKKYTKAKKLLSSRRPPRSKKEFHDSHASGSSDGTDFESAVTDEQHRKTSGDSEKEYGDEDDIEGNDDNDGDDDDDVNDDDNQEDDDKNDDEEETDSDRIKSDRIKIHVLNQSAMEYYVEEEKEKVNDGEKMDEEDDEVTKELYRDVNVNMGNKDANMTDADQGGACQQNVSQESGFEHVRNKKITTCKLLDKVEGLVLLIYNSLGT